MTNFKGTKGKWKVRGEYRIDIITDNDKAFGIVDFGTEQEAFLADYPIEQWKANALLISKAPEMLEEIQESLIDIQILRDQIAKESEINHRFEGMAGIMDNWINRKKQLIKEATEL